ncbi:AAA family ATPase [Candidatus Woesearchaeota archaeon]|nr:AAA family ATPase [Candidatus Woesearchaeota archaeon]
MVYKIGLVGTHGTGKTSLAALIEGELKRRGMEAIKLPEISTEARKRGLSINRNTTLGTQMWILHQQFANELELSEESAHTTNYQVIITDRGPDNYCYLEHSVGENDYALQMTLGHLSLFPYDALYLLPRTNGNIQNNGTRDLDKNFQIAMDEKVRAFFDKYQIAHRILPLPKPEDRYRQEWVEIIVNDTMERL